MLCHISIYQLFSNLEGRMTLVEQLNAADEKRKQGNWYPAANGTETAFKTRSGVTLLYCYQPSTGNHAYLNCETDLILSEEESQSLLSL